MSEAARRKQIGEVVDQEMSRAFDLAVAPLVRMTLVKLAAEDFLLLVSSHQIVFDQLSGNVLLRELSAHYAQQVCKDPTPPAPLPMQYADYAGWEREWNQSDVAEQQLEYWRKTLSGAPAMLELPTDHPRPAVQSFRAATESVRLKDGIYTRLRLLARQLEVSPTAIALAAFQTLLVRYSRQNDVAVSLPVPGRAHACLKNLIGYFSNTLVIRTNLADVPSPSFRTVLGRVCRAVVGAHQNQEIPFERVVEALQPERNVSHGPLSQVLFSWQEEEAEVCVGGGVSMRVEPLYAGSTKYDVALHMDVNGDGLTARIQYAKALFDQDTIVRMLRNFEVLLEGILAEPDASIMRLPLLTPEETRRVLVEWNQTEAAYPRDACFHQLFEQQAEKTPEAVAVRRGTEEITYAQLNRRANKLAHFLRDLLVGPDVLVGVCMSRSIDMMVALLGVLKAGGAYLPLDPAYPPERLAYMLQDAKAPVLLTEVACLESIPSTNAIVVCVDTDGDQLAGRSEGNLPPTATPEDLAYVIYTSGSTGRPKGAMIPHRGLVNYLTWAIGAYPVAEGRGAPVHSSISFDLTITGLFAPLLVGKTVQFIAEEREIEGLTETLRSEFDYSLVKITPAHLELLSRQLAQDNVAGRTRSFIIGGENLLAESIAFWQDHAPDTVLVNEYGPTETVVGCCVYIVGAGERRPGSIPIGRPIANTRLYILDAMMQPVPIGVAGELYIGGAGVGRGYLNQPALTAEKFVPDPFSGDRGGRLYKTGDLVRYLPDSNIEFLGRIDHQVKIRGYRIELGEVEAAARLFPGIQDAAVIVREDTPGDKRIVTYVVGSPGAPVLPFEIREFLKRHLPAFMLPSAIVPIARIPLTTNGKVDRGALPLPDGTSQVVPTPCVAPRDATEEALLTLWAQAVGLSGTAIGVHDNFFDLGGHSLTVVSLVNEIKRSLEVDLPILQIFQTPTIAQIAKAIDARRISTHRHPTVSTFRKSGSQVPIYFMYSGPDEFRIAELIDASYPAYGIEIPWPTAWCEAARHNHLDALPTIEQITAPFVRELANHMKGNTCILAGYSFAGILAFEAAHQLLRQGREVRQLLILDAWKRYPSMGQMQQIPHLIHAGIRSSWRLTRSVLSGTRRKTDPIPVVPMIDGITARLDEEGNRVPWEILQVLYESARRRYNPAPLKIPGVLFQALNSEDKHLIDIDPAQGWDSYFKGPEGLRIFHAPGDHLSMIRHKPHAAVTAKLLNEYLSASASSVQ